MVITCENKLFAALRGDLERASLRLIREIRGQLREHASQISKISEMRSLTLALLPEETRANVVVAVDCDAQV